MCIFLFFIKCVSSKLIIFIPTNLYNKMNQNFSIIYIIRCTLLTLTTCFWVHWSFMCFMSTSFCILVICFPFVITSTHIIIILIILLILIHDTSIIKTYGVSNPILKAKHRIFFRNNFFWFLRFKFHARILLRFATVT